MNQPCKQIVIPKEQAVFWMDGNGTWHNEHGKFEHPKIIRYFNSSIQKDEQGYHLSQFRDGMEEKVYFNYEETAVFAVTLVGNETISLLLNTGMKVDLDPENLFERNDNLYMDTPEHLIKFAQGALLKLSRYLSEDEGGLILDYGGTRYDIKKQ